MGEYTYDAFGNVFSDDVPDPFGYCGEYRDGENGLIYLRNRYYDSADGRFITEDPVKDSLNWYVYCGNNPLMFIDPMGLEKEGDKEKYGENTATYWALQDLGYSWQQYPEYRKDIEKLADTIRKDANIFGSKNIDSTISVFDKKMQEFKSLSYTEKVICVMNPLLAYDTMVLKERAETLTSEYFVNWNDDNGVENAFKHALWNALLTQCMGKANAKLMTDAHEFGHPEYGDIENGIGSISTRMDLYNNGIGRSIGEESMRKMPNEICATVYDKLEKGLLVYVVYGKLEATKLK